MDTPQYTHHPIPDNGDYRTLEVFSTNDIDVYIYEHCLVYNYSRHHVVNRNLFSDDAGEERDESLESLLRASSGEGMHERGDHIISKMAAIEMACETASCRPGYLKVSVCTALRTHAFYFSEDQGHCCQKFYKALRFWKYGF